MDDERFPSWRELWDDVLESLHSTQFWLGLMTGALCTIFGLLILYISVGYDLYR